MNEISIRMVGSDNIMLEEFEELHSLQDNILEAQQCLREFASNRKYKVVPADGTENDFYIMQSGNKIIAACEFQNGVNCPEDREVSAFFVVPEYQHKGLGVTLLTVGLTQQRLKGNKTVGVMIPEKCGDLRSFLEEFGFKESERRISKLYNYSNVCYTMEL